MNPRFIVKGKRRSPFNEKVADRHGYFDKCMIYNFNAINSVWHGRGLIQWTE